MTTTTQPWTNLTDKRVLITGATSGLGFEAAIQLASAGVGAITITARSAEKGAAAQSALVEATGKSLFNTIIVDVADLTSSRLAAEQLVGAGLVYDGLILNAGMVPNQPMHTADGYDECFASSLIGHHLIAERLIGAELLADQGRVIIVGSEAANNDLPKAMGMTVPAFLTDPSPDDADFHSELDTFAHGPTPYKSNDQYAGTKAISAMWAASMQRRADRYEFVAVSPGAAMATNAARHTTGMFKMMIAVMSRVGGVMGMNQSVPDAAARYTKVLLGTYPAVPGGLYTSPPKKMTGPLTERHVTYLEDPRTQDLAIAYLDSVVGVPAK